MDLARMPEEQESVAVVDVPPTADAVPDVPTDGRALVLQAHETGAQGPVRYRNVWVKPLDPILGEWNEWQTIEIDEDLSAWQVIGGVAEYRVENNEIIGKTVPAVLSGTGAY